MVISNSPIIVDREALRNVLHLEDESPRELFSDPGIEVRPSISGLDGSCACFERTAFITPKLLKNIFLIDDDFVVEPTIAQGHIPLFPDQRSVASLADFFSLDNFYDGETTLFENSVKAVENFTSYFDAIVDNLVFSLRIGNLMF